MKLHPFCEAFPEITGEKFERLKSDIKENGLRDAIVTLDGMILDGQNRFKACEALDVKPRFEEFNGKDPLKFVLSKNLHRRHLDVGQRAFIAARLSEASFIGRNGCSGRNTLTQDKAAEIMEVSRGAVIKARKAINKSEALGEQLRDGEVTLNEANAVSNLSKKKVDKLARENAAAIKKKAREERKKEKERIAKQKEDERQEKERIKEEERERKEREKAQKAYQKNRMDKSGAKEQSTSTKPVAPGSFLGRIRAAEAEQAMPEEDPHEDDFILCPECLAKIKEWNRRKPNAVIGNLIKEMSL